MSLRTRVTLLVVLLCVALALVIGYAEGEFNARTVRQLMEDQEMALATRTSEEIDQRVLLRLESLAAMARLIPASQVDDRDKMQSWLGERIALSGQFDWIGLVARDGRAIARIPFDPSILSLNLSDREYFQRVFATGKPTISKPLITRLDTEPMIFLISPVVDSNGKVVAALTGSLSLSRKNFLGDLAAARVGKGGGFALITRDRQVIVARDQSRVLTFLPGPGVNADLDRAMVGHDRVIEAVDRNGVRNFYAYKWLRSAPWMLTVIYPADEVFDSIKRSRTETWAVALCLVALFAPFVWWFMRRLLAPLRDLHNTVRDLRGKTSGAANVKIARRDEIGLLAEEFNALSQERHDAQRALAAKEQTLAHLVGNLPGLVYRCLNDPDWTILFASNGCRDLTGFEPSELEQNRVASYGNLVHPDDRDVRWAKCQAALDAHLPCHNEYRIIDKTGQTRWVLEHAAGIYDTDGKLEAVEGFVQDITARKNADEAARIAAQSILDKRDAEAASRAKTEFLNRMSHELRTPLNGILGFSQLLRLDEKEPLSGAQHDGIQLIQDAGTHLLQLINEMLDLSRIEAGRVELTLAPLRVADAVRECIALVRPMATARNVHIVSEADSPPLAVLADPLRIRQVLVNLASNAIKYNRPGGSIRIFCAELPAGRVEICVEDDGIGLTPEQLENLFQPFNRLGLDQLHSEGTGLGMVITKGLVEAMSGEISVRSAPRQGTVVSVRLPRASSPSLLRASTEPASSLGSADYGERTIVYIEDNIVNATLIARIIAKRPQIKLHIAGDGASGIELVRDTRPDVVLIDLDLPDMSGNEVLKRLQAVPALAGLPCIALTASVRTEVVEESKSLGFIDFIGKPVDVRGFLARIDRLLERRRAHEEDPAGVTAA